MDDQPAIAFRMIEVGSREYRAALQLRDELLRKPLGLSLSDEDLSGEVRQLHLAGFDSHGGLVAYLQLQPGAGGDEMRMRQAAGAAARQGRGIGGALVAEAEERVRDAGFRRVVLHAREVVVGFYESLGYSRVGGRFLEVGIPHFKMEKGIR